MSNPSLLRKYADIVAEADKSNEDDQNLVILESLRGALITVGKNVKANQINRAVISKILVISSALGVFVATSTKDPAELNKVLNFIEKLPDVVDSGSPHLEIFYKWATTFLANTPPESNKQVAANTEAFVQQANASGFDSRIMQALKRISEIESKLRSAKSAGSMQAAQNPAQRLA